MKSRKTHLCGHIEYTFVYIEIHEARETIHLPTKAWTEMEISLISTISVKIEILLMRILIRGIIPIKYDNSGFQVVSNHKSEDRPVDLADDEDIWLRKGSPSE